MRSEVIFTSNKITGYQRVYSSSCNFLSKYDVVFYYVNTMYELSRPIILAREYITSDIIELF